MENKDAHKSFLRAALLLVAALFMTASAQNAPAAETPQIQLVAVQMTLDMNDFWSPEAFEAAIRERMVAVTAATDPDLPTLVVFPEDVGLLLVLQGMESRLSGISSIEEAISAAVQSQVVGLAWTRLIRWKSWVPALFLNRNRQIAETYFGVFSEVARDHGVYVVGGSVVLPPYRIQDGVVQWQRGPERHDVRNTSYLFGPDGSVLGKQDKVELIELELDGALNLNAGRIEDLTVIDTPLGRIGLAICLDAFSDEITQALVDQGAQILVQPSANPGPWNDWQQEDWLRSSHRMVAAESRFSYAVNPMLNGPLWEIDFYGQSGIVAAGAPDAGLGYADTGPADGFIRVAESADSEELLVATVTHPDHLDRPPLPVR